MRDRIGRRGLLRVLAATPLAVWASGVQARDYTSAAEVLDEIDRLEADLDRRLARVAAAGAFAASVHADHERHRRERAVLRRRLRLPASREAAAPATLPPIDVESLRTVAQDLVHAHAEGLPALGDAAAVDTLARHMVVDARHLAIIQMWGEAEEQRG
ncbi:MAG: hypothetical protein DMF78_06620 [Acidobacteria bacterium]|nr:MAG: hypothetical protein DMF78_06620 [Acidobacteriota bacterium]